MKHEGLSPKSVLHTMQSPNRLSPRGGEIRMDRLHTTEIKTQLPLKFISHTIYTSDDDIELTL